MKSMVPQVMKIKMRIRSLVLLLCILAMAGCTSGVDSDDVRTASIIADTEVIVYDSTTVVKTLLRDDFGIFGGKIVLRRGDQLSATLNGDTVNLSRMNTNEYTGDFDSAEDGAELKVALTREKHIDALNSSVTLPPRFDIDSPDQGETYRSGDNITTVWSPSDSGNLVGISYTFNCKPEGDDTSLLDDVRFYSVEDTGTHTTTVTDILNARGPQPIINGVPCPVELEISRRNYGEIDAALEGGSIDAIRSRTMDIIFIP